MLVLGIESSCDESAISILQYSADTCSGTTEAPKILFELISSQVDLHAQYGGVVPELAAREHLKNLALLLEQADKFLNQHSLKLDLIAVTRGPGLKGCLLIGYQFAKGIALAKNLPLIGINHIEAHLHAYNLSTQIPETEKYPFLALIVSGGHTELIFVREFSVYQVISRTIDDAAGEAFDKSANLLGFQYPGGAALASLADTVNTDKSNMAFGLPKVMRESDDFSFSGLKTAISLLIKRNAGIIDNQQIRAELANSIQASIVDSLMHKTKAALQKLQIKFVTATGGVACNSLLRKRLINELNCLVYFPEKKHCVDNASMVALVGAIRFAHKGFQADHDQEVLARWPIEDCNV